jgi:hypothetical protein
MILQFNFKTMPKFDKTGPSGAGPTGWGKGTCTGDVTFQNGFFGRGRGGRRGVCRFFFGQGNNAVSLDEEEKFLTQRLDVVRKAKENSKKE